MTRRLAIRDMFAMVLLAFALISLPVFAEEAESGEAETLETADQEILIQSGISQATEGKLQEAASREEEKIEYINNLLRELAGMEPQNVTREIIVQIHDEYTTLSMAGRTKVSGYDLVETYIASMRLEFQTEKPTEGTAVDSGKKLGQKYMLNFSDSVSVSISYVTDSNRDGIAERPNISLTSPSESSIPLTYGTTAVEDARIKLFVTWEADFVQLDIYSAEKGLWTISTSNSVVFNSFSYTGNSDSEAFESAVPLESESGTYPASGPSKAAQARRKLLAGLFVIGAVIFGVFYGLKKLTSKNTEGDQKKKKNKSESEYGSLLDDDDDFNWEDLAKEKAEKELQDMRRYLKSQEVSGEYDIEAGRGSIDTEASTNASGDEPEEEAQEEFTEYPSGIIGDDTELQKVVDELFGKRF